MAATAQQFVVDDSLIKLSTGERVPDSILGALIAMIRVDMFTQQDKKTVAEAAKRAEPHLGNPELVQNRKLAKDAKKEAVARILAYMIEHKNTVKYITIPGGRFVTLKSRRKINAYALSVIANVVESMYKSQEFINKFANGMTAGEYDLFVKRQQLTFLNDVLKNDEHQHSIGVVKKLPTESVIDQLNAIFASIPPQQQPNAATA